MLKYYWLDNFYIYCVYAFSAVFNIKFNLVVFFDLVNEASGVNENVLAAAIWYNETKTFCFIIKFNCSLLHYILYYGRKV